MKGKTTTDTKNTEQSSRNPAAFARLSLRALPFHETVNSGSSTSIFASSSSNDRARAITFAPHMIKRVNEATLSKTEITMDAPSMVIFVSPTRISVPDTPGDGTPIVMFVPQISMWATHISISPTQILMSVTQISICGKPLDFALQRVAALADQIGISATQILICATQIGKSATQITISNAALLISKRDLIIGAQDVVMSAPQSIIETPRAIIFVGGITISTAEIDINKADIIISAFHMSFFGAEIRFSAAEKTAGDVPAGMSVRPSKDHQWR